MRMFSRKLRAGLLAGLVAVLLCAPPVFAEEYVDPGVVSVVLPSEIPFRLAVAGGLGVVDSDEFVIENLGAYPAEVRMENILVTVTDPDNYLLSPVPELPEDKSALYLTLLCTAQDGGTSEFVLSAYEGAGPSFWLGSGERVTFRFGGAVRERSETPWEGAPATVAIQFGMTSDLPTASIAPPEAYLPPEEILPPPEPETVPPSEPETEPMTEPETEPMTEIETESETEPVTETATEPITEPEIEVVTEAGTETGSETGEAA